MEIDPSARKHGISDEDIEYALEHRLYIANLDDDGTRVLYLGPDRASNLLEIIVIERRRANDLVIHATKMSRRYEEFLR